MKYYIIETQENAEAKPQPVTQSGKVRRFAAPQTAIRMGRIIKDESGHIVKVVSKGHEGPPEVITC